MLSPGVRAVIASTPPTLSFTSPIPTETARQLSFDFSEPAKTPRQLSFDFSEPAKTPPSPLSTPDPPSPTTKRGGAGKGGKGKPAVIAAAVAIIANGGDPLEAAKSLNPLANTTDAIRQGEGGLDIAKGLVKDSYWITPVGMVHSAWNGGVGLGTAFREKTKGTSTAAGDMTYDLVEPVLGHEAAKLAGASNATGTALVDLAITAATKMTISEWRDLLR